MLHNLNLLEFGCRLASRQWTRRNFNLITNRSSVVHFSPTQPSKIHGWMKEISGKIRTHSKLPNSHPISTRAVISWIFSSDFVSLIGAVVRRTVTYFLPLILFALLILPILFVWNHKGLDSGYKAVLTLLVFGGAITVTVIPGAYWDWWARSTRIRQTIFEVRLLAERLREHSGPTDAEHGNEMSDPIR